jgi:cephalosporin-C deacetylase-like acetyl esterase
MAPDEAGGETNPSSFNRGHTMKRNVEFNSKGSKIRGVLVTPESGQGPFPVAVMGGGWCYVKEIVLPHYAQAILKAGVAVLMFDYRGLGESEGPIRQHPASWDQIEDYKNAISFVMKQPEVNPERLGIWGISYAGGHVIAVGATDARVKCIVSTVPVVEGWETMRRCHGERQFEKLLKLVAEDRVKRSSGEPGGTMHMSHPDPVNNLSTWPFPHVHEIFMNIKKAEAPRHEHWNTIESTELLLEYDIFPFAKRILNTPTQVVIAEGDNITQWDLELAMYNSIPASCKEVVMLPKTSHMSLYAEKKKLEMASSAHARFLKKHLIDEYVEPF